MKALAQAIVDAIAFLDLSDETMIPRETADEVLEIIAGHLKTCTPDEREAVIEIVREQYRVQNEAAAPEELLDFYENFEEAYLGIDD